jgi:hypothetical protein
MSEFIIDIGVEVEDTFINNDVEWMAKIVDAAHKHTKVTIKIYEPVAIEELNYKGKKFLQILAELCEKNNWQKDKFHFEIQNLIQDMSVWPSIQVPYSNTIFLDNLQEDKKVKEQKHFKKLFGVLVNRSSWDRLMISSYLYKNHKDKTFQKYCNDLNNPRHMINFDLDRLLWETSKSGELSGELLEQITTFMKELPMGDHVYDIYNGDEDKIVEHATGDSVTSYYNHFFVDIVCEKMKKGKVLYLTEKTARPLITMNPFIINASVGHLSSLRKLGFKTFSDYWSEEYDHQEGVERIKSIQKICDDLSTLPQEEIQAMYQNMLPLLRDNRDCYKNLTNEYIQKSMTKKRIKMF